MYKYITKTYGYGCDLFIGTINKNAFYYFRKHNIDFLDYAFNSTFTPRPRAKYMPFKPGKPFNSKAFYTGRGPYMNKNSLIEVYDHQMNKIWTSQLTINALTSKGCKVHLLNFCKDFHLDGHGYFIIDELNGIHMNDSFITSKKFDPSKIKCIFFEFKEYTFLAEIRYGRHLLSDSSATPEGKGVVAGIFPDAD